MDGEGFVAQHVLRQPEPQRHAVDALKSLNYRVISACDSYNDTGMLTAADASFFVHAPAGLAAQFPQFKLQVSLDELRASIGSAAQGASDASTPVNPVLGFGASRRFNRDASY